MVTELKTNNLFELDILKQIILVFISEKELTNIKLPEQFDKYFDKIIYTTLDKNPLNTIQNEDLNNLLLVIDLNNTDTIKILEKLNNQIKNQLNIILLIDSNNLNLIESSHKYKISNYLLKPINFDSFINLFTIMKKQIEQKKQKDTKIKELNIYKNILDKQNLISETDLKGNITYVNDIFCKVSGYSKDELIGKSHSIIRHPSNSSKIYENLWETIKSGNVWKGKLKNISKEGNVYYVKSYISPIFNDDGEIIKYIGSKYLVTKEEEEKQILKKFILQQKSQKIKQENELEQKYQNMMEKSLENKDKQVAIFVSELHSEIKVLRSKIEDSKGRILNLEHKLADSQKKNEIDHEDFLQKLSKMRTTTRISYEKYEKFKKQNDALKEKIEKAQESIKVYQEYIEEYRQKIDDLNDVIKSYEDDKKKAAEEAAKK
ncbi:hypothetical protein CPU12_06845 [Malaciobacter molluscorum LMG 25693]|uniref:PAS sensor-containing two-component system response regulator n=1 Tax=Malaciobacter molluscorum LMG 25693 TaxID=870501 RepID=A0A2G1DIK3_9BACT|nr:PAS domain-containing protein [Malaciobacter molluscorum]AXX92374.1 PAS sensor-containing two-component system response regulator [Malaciobacter molluscorum LMG 25693]PHO18176.1 hypothetical protein CPU12_06845 [Malaciobacter molluscorum LMG 25693]RXJ93965.1 hypothetical protein CRV00_08790 [Malaciobacter molluscorum]